MQRPAIARILRVMCFITISFGFEAGPIAAFTY